MAGWNYCNSWFMILGRLLLYSAGKRRLISICCVSVQALVRGVAEEAEFERANGIISEHPSATGGLQTILLYVPDQVIQLDLLRFSIQSW